jgi:hypothetical protein
MARKPHNLKDQPFGCLVALEPTPLRRRRSVVWRCRCKKCGAEALVAADRLRAGTTRSCRCLRRDNVGRSKFTRPQLEVRNKEVARLRGEGLTLEQIGARVKLSKQGVGRILSKAGLGTGRIGRPPRAGAGPER